MEPTVSLPTERTATESSGSNLQWWDNWDEVSNQKSWDTYYKNM